MKKVKVKIYKPVNDNKGKKLPLSTLLQFEKMLLNNAGGFTTYKARGVWPSEGVDYWDDIKVYEMIVDNNPSIIANLRAQALVIKQEMQQDCVLFTVEPMLEVEFV